MASPAEEFKVDRTGWPAGPWSDEPDRIEWASGRGFPVLMLRQRTSGHWCGYVAVPPGHPWHGKSWDFITPRVHGGVTYAEECLGLVCHVPAPGEPDNVWWIGFDCHHYGDSSPMEVLTEERLGLRSCGIYRDVAYVRNEVEGLARQAKEAANG